MVHQRCQEQEEESTRRHDEEELEELQAAEETLTMREKDLEGGQMRVGKEDGTRDRHPSEKKNSMTLKTTNSLICSHA